MQVLTVDPGTPRLPGPEGNFPARDQMADTHWRRRLATATGEGPVEERRHDALWVAMCMYLLLAYLKFVMRLRWSLHQMLQVLQLNMFERRPLQDLFTTPSLTAPSGSQLSLAWS